MAINFKVIKAWRIPSADPNRLGKFDWLVIYQLDPMDRHIVTIPKETPTEGDIKEAVRKDIEERGKFEGKEFTT